MCLRAHQNLDSVTQSTFVLLFFLLLNRKGAEGGGGVSVGKVKQGDREVQRERGAVGESKYI